MKKPASTPDEPAAEAPAAEEPAPVRRARWRGPQRVHRFLVPGLVGLVTFGAVTAFASSLSVSTKSLASGNATVGTCNASATVTYNTTYASALPGYKVTTTPVTTAAACASMAYKVTLTGSGNAALGEVTGTLDATGAASPDFSSSNIAASLVTGVSVVITG